LWALSESLRLTVVLGSAGSAARGGGSVPDWAWMSEDRSSKDITGAKRFMSLLCSEFVLIRFFYVRSLWDHFSCLFAGVGRFSAKMLGFGGAG
jgi:hypothetical protein